VNPYLTLSKVDSVISGRALTDDEMPAVERLREMRNLAAHSVDPDITITDALRYHDIANALIQRITQQSDKQ